MSSLQTTVLIRACPCGERILTRSEYYWIGFSFDTHSNEITISGKSSQIFNLNCPYCGYQGTFLCGPATYYKPLMTKYRGRNENYTPEHSFVISQECEREVKEEKYERFYEETLEQRQNIREYLEASGKV